MLGHQPHRPPGTALQCPAGAQGHSGETGGVPGDGPRAGVRGGGVCHLLRQPGPGLHTGAVPGEDGRASVPVCHVPLSGLPADPAGAQLLQLSAKVDTGAPGPWQDLHRQDIRQSRHRPQPPRHHQGRHSQRIIKVSHSSSRRLCMCT